MTAPQIQPEHLANYIAALREHDWQFGFSGDVKVYRVGRDSLAALRQAQVLIDADFMVWNQWAPEEHRVHVVRGIA